MLVPTPDDARLRCDLLLALGDVQRRAGIATYRDTVAQAVATARALADGERLALAVLTNARPGGLFASANAVDAELIALYEEAAAALGGADSLLRARLLGQLAVELVHTQDRDRRDALSHEAIAIARRLGDRSGLAQVLVLRLYAINDPFTLAERLGLIAELTELASELGSSELGWHAANHRSGALLESGDIAGAERALSETERLAGALRQPYYAWIARMGRAMLAVMRGAADAEAQALSTFELGTAAGQPDAASAFGAELSNVRHNAGRSVELVDATQATVEAQPHNPAWRAVLARTYCEIDRPAEAREQIDILRRDGVRLLPNWVWTAYMVCLSDAVCDMRRRCCTRRSSRSPGRWTSSR